MAVRELVFDIFAVDRASKTLSRVGSEAEIMGGKFGKAGKLASTGIMIAGAVAVDLGIHAVKMAGDFDAAITRLETTAGESPKALKMVGDGLLAMAGKVGYTAQELAVGMYTVESAGYHGAAGLKVMEAAAKGARVEGADLTVTTDAVSSLLVDYHLKASDAARVTNVLTAAVGHGKTTFEGLAAALPNVAAAGATANISMEELASAIATMTMHGTDAAKAGTYLRQVIGQLEGPTAKARMVMKGLGIDSNELGLKLSSGTGHGLADAIEMVDKAITNHLTPAGLVAIDTFRKSKNPVSAYQKVLADLPPTLTTSFGALSQMVGGVKSLQGFLQLGGENLKTYKSNVAAVREQVRKGGKDVEGYATQQATLNGKLADAHGATTALAVSLGTKLEPAAKATVGEFTDFVTVMNKHQTVTLRALEITALLAGSLLVIKTVSLAAAAATAIFGGAETLLALRLTIGAVAAGDMAGATAGLALTMESAAVATSLFAGAAGLGLLVVGAHTSNKALSVLETTAGGAALGFAVGGPIGAAIGAGAGALFGLAHATNSSTHAAKLSIGPWKDYTATLNGVHAGVTTATRDMAFQHLQSSGLLKATRALGLSDRDAVSAMVGSHAAREKLVAAMSLSTTVTNAEKRALEAETGAVARSRLAQLQRNVAVAQGTHALKQAKDALAAFMREPANKRFTVTGVEKAARQLHDIHNILMSVTGQSADLNVSLNGLGTLPTKKTGHAGGTSYARAGWSRVGETGPEDVWLNEGSRVVPAALSKHPSGGMGEAAMERAMSRALRGMTLSGTLDTPFGPASVRGVVQSEKSADSHFDRAVGAMKRD